MTGAIEKVTGLFGRFDATDRAALDLASAYVRSLGADRRHDRDPVMAAHYEGRLRGLAFRFRELEEDAFAESLESRREGPGR